MNQKLLLLVSAFLVVAPASFGEVTIKTEQLNPADPAGNFKTIPEPSKSDLATSRRAYAWGMPTTNTVRAERLGRKLRP